jgi:hypothetical protein
MYETVIDRKLAELEESGFIIKTACTMLVLRKGEELVYLHPVSGEIYAPEKSK